jgi:cation diffusion facilitator CzcD-associated flavoprotein CzcO
MKTKLGGDPRLVDRIIPKNFNPGCRRPTPAPGYLEALVAPNSSVFTDPIGRITETGFVDHEGKHHEVDVIICATGFDTSWLPRFGFNNGKKDLRDLWSPENGVTSYLSISIPEFPNHFTFCGP